MESGTSIYPTCHNAFFQPNLDSFTSAPVYPPRKISDSNIPTLMRLIAAVDNDYKTKNNNWKVGTHVAPPSMLRSDASGTTSQARLEQGLTRIRDSFRHAFKDTEVSHLIFICGLPYIYTVS